MKILLTVDPEIPVPPKLYGGIERIVDGLVTGYSQLGHEVYLMAHPESSSKNAQGIIGWKGKKSNGGANILRNSLQLSKCYEDIRPDIIHSFSRLLYTYPLMLSTKASIIQSYQRSISKKTTMVAQLVGRNNLHFTACAFHLYRDFKISTNWSTVYNFTDTEFFTPDTSSNKDYLIFLGRIEEIKGAKEGIEVALQTKHKLIIAGNIPEDKKEYFEKEIKPFLADPLIEYVGPVNDEQKKYYLQNAKALLFPIKWAEPFGIVMAESMACGTPVIAFDNGSVNEVIVNHLNGYKVNSLNEMVEAVNKIHYISRERTREYAEKRFALKVIAQQYLSVFENILDEKAKGA